MLFSSHRPVLPQNPSASKALFSQDECGYNRRSCPGYSPNYLAFAGVSGFSRPPSPGKIQTETADDFTVTNCVVINQATFTGLIPSGAPLSSVANVEVEIYHLFPIDSDTNRTLRVPTRTGSPADNEIDDATRDSLHGSLSFTVTLLNASFTAANSVVNGINPIPNQRTGGEGPVTGQEVLITVTFNPPIALPANHYFFRPEAQLSSGNFLWLSAPKTIPAPADLQSWIRNDNLAPDWLRIGTDIVGGSPAPTFNAAFSLSGETDADCDGVADSLDLCPGTPPGAVVDAHGCSIDQIAPCNGPASGGPWRSEDQAQAIITTAAQSKCGAKAR
ncbi:MAG: hypothetical protein DME26_22375 [Verrucomicrobia bacterium]|nr:MAG: hypothetical protein DME26_22375 [Verrucomicrobiota bacterium]